jgi:hypothetical protein
METKHLICLVIIGFLLYKLLNKNENFALDSNVYACQTKCQQYKDGYIWMWENWNKKDGDMYANCILECMNLNKPISNMLGYTMDNSISGEYRYTPSSP